MPTLKNEIIITSIKSTLGLIPYFGTALNESIFEHRSRVKQNRINDFVQSLSDYFEKLEIEHPKTSHILSDEFGDIFETIIRKVSQTSSKEKAKRFKLILANQLLNIKPTDFIETYIEIISSLNDVQIRILEAHINFKSESEKKSEELSNASKTLNELKAVSYRLREKSEKGTLKNDESIAENMKNILQAQAQLLKLQEDPGTSFDFLRCSHYGIKEGEFLFFKQDLVSKGLMSDVGKKTPYLIMNITEFGIGLLNYIRE